VSDSPSTTLYALKSRWAIYTLGELKQRCQELDCGSFLIAGLIPNRTLSIVVGDSGLGKSPLLYQAALCVAAGRPFLGRPVSKGRVLYLDFENGLGDVEDLVVRLSRHLGLGAMPEDLLLWNFNDASPGWEPAQLADMIREANAAWVIIDSLGAFAPDIEEKASNVTRVYQEFRKSIRECGTSITGVHHLRKPSSKPDEAPPPLEDDPHRWFLQARGSRALINGADVRIGVDRSGRAKQFEGFDGRSCEVALVIGGFGRVRGNVATTFLARILDEDDDPLGYNELRGVSLLFNPEQEAAYQAFPAVFRFKDAQASYGKGPQATTDFLKKCIGVGIMRKDGREYRRLEVPE
jgi:AAA domain